MPEEEPTGDERRPSSIRREEPSTVQLLERARAGDRAALDQLARRYMPPLRRWASGRLPRWARDLMDTEDVVQETLLKTIRNVDGFRPRHDGALHAYLRQALANRIREEMRRVVRRPERAMSIGDRPDSDASPLEQAIGREALESYEGALSRLREEEREAIVARVELGLTYADVAQALGKPTPDAARMAVSRALVRLAKEMGHER